MTSLPKRDPAADHLLAPENSALILIDYQPPQVYTSASIERGALVRNVVALAKTAKLYKLPIVLSTVNVRTGINQPTIPQLREVIPDVPEIDRTSINSWEDADFLDAVKATGRRKLIIGALWTEACLLFPTLDALKEGFEVFPVADAVGGTSREAHHAALSRMVHAGAQPTSCASLACELQRDWNRHETAPGFVENFIDHGLTPGWYFALEAGQKRAAGR
ncbi:Nicotinamidase-related amidase [Sinosporangium album]|uniref:Nicotinamidase-related amidase n=1 Tax=Sinosporangium album TaxID=504805 RepID=A0A1G7R5U7_9ACTN|nr:hydrolase [Sinosporangium album]SDG06108.1 Nicotinamidase-related amidase [Sinosporangium album]